MFIPNKPSNHFVPLDFEDDVDVSYTKIRRHNEDETYDPNIYEEDDSLPYNITESIYKHDRIR